MTTSDRPTDTPDAAAERLRHDFHEDENSPLLQPEEDDRIRDDVLSVVAELERLRAAGTPDAGPTIGQAYVRLAPWLRELDGPDLDNFYAVFARLRDEWQTRTPDPSPVGEGAEGGHEFNDRGFCILCGRTRESQREIDRLKATLARVEEKAASWQKKAELLEEMHAGMVDQRDEARQQLAAPAGPGEAGKETP